MGATDFSPNTRIMVCSAGAATFWPTGVMVGRNTTAASAATFSGSTVTRLTALPGATIPAYFDRYPTGLAAIHELHVALAVAGGTATFVCHDGTTPMSPAFDASVVRSWSFGPQGLIVRGGFALVQVGVIQCCVVFSAQPTQV